MFTVNVTITGLDQANQSLQNIKAALGNFEPEYQQISDMLLEYFTNQVFDTEGGVLGAPWAPLTVKYAIYKAKKFGSQQILVATGRLRASWKSYTSTDALLIRNEAQNEAGEYYGARHQDGDGNVPKREIMDFNDQLLSEIRDIAINSLNTRLQEAVV